MHTGAAGGGRARPPPRPLFPPLCCDRLRGLIDDVLRRRASLVSTFPETSHTCGGCEVCPRHLPRQLLSSPVCRRPLKAAQRDGQTRSDAACFRLKTNRRRKEKPFRGIYKVSRFPVSTGGETTCVALVWLSHYQGSLANCPLILRVNKNGFGWNRLPVSCLKPTGSRDSLMFILFFHRSHSLCCNTNLQDRRPAFLFQTV